MIMKQRLLSLSVHILWSFILYAQPKLPDNIFLKKLSNGLEVLVVEDNSVPLATVMITVKNGSYTETQQLNGLSHLYEHMFFKGDKKYNSQEEFMKRISELGISFNGRTTFENVSYFFTLPSKNLKPGLKLMNAAIRYPSFNPKEMEREKQVVDAEFLRDESNPAYALANEMDHHLWGALFYRKKPIGNHDVIRSATPDLMDSIRIKYYYPNNSLLTIAGNVNHNDAFKEAEKVFGDWGIIRLRPLSKMACSRV